LTEDLAGIKVSHDVTAFEEGEHILTLKDSRILDGEGQLELCSFPIGACTDALLLPLACSAEDELMNLDLAGQEEDAKNIDLKRKKREYDGYDDEEFDPGMLGVKKKVLSKYDVDIEGAQDGVGLLFLPLQENPSQLRS
jgi:U4/U6.U5 tri-snRNP-associated protein 1